MEYGYPMYLVRKYYKTPCIIYTYRVFQSVCLPCPNWAFTIKIDYYDMVDFFFIPLFLPFRCFSVWFFFFTHSESEGDFGPLRAGRDFYCANGSCECPLHRVKHNLRNVMRYAYTCDHTVWPHERQHNSGFPGPMGSIMSYYARLPAVRKMISTCIITVIRQSVSFSFYFCAIFLGTFFFFFLNWTNVNAHHQRVIITSSNRLLEPLAGAIFIAFSNCSIRS